MKNRREEVKLMAYGQYAAQNIEGTIDKNEMILFSEGVLFGYDLASEETRKESTWKIGPYDLPKPLPPSWNEVK